jgi:hypothetical protein
MNEYNNALDRERTIPTERLPLVGEVSFADIEVAHGQCGDFHAWEDYFHVPVATPDQGLSSNCLNIGHGHLISHRTQFILTIIFPFDPRKFKKSKVKLSP